MIYGHLPWKAETKNELINIIYKDPLIFDENIIISD